MLHDGLQPQPGLLCSGNDLVGWQEETIVPSISQLKSECILDAVIVCPINAAPTSLICKSEEKDTTEAQFFSGLGGRRPGVLHACVSLGIQRSFCKSLGL